MSRCHSCSKQQLECDCATEKRLLKDKNEKLRQALKNLVDLIKTSRVEGSMGSFHLRDSIEFQCAQYVLLDSTQQGENNESLGY